MNDSVKSELDNFMQGIMQRNPARRNFTRRFAKSANRSYPFCWKTKNTATPVSSNG